MERSEEELLPILDEDENENKVERGALSSPIANQEDEFKCPRNIADDKQAMRQLTNKTFNATLWRRWFDNHCESRDKDAQRAMRFSLLSLGASLASALML